MLEREFDDFDVLTFRCNAAANRGPVFRRISADEQAHPLGQRSGTHEHVGHLTQITYVNAKLLLGFPGCTGSRIIAIEQAGAGLNHGIGISRHMGGNAHLLHQQNGFSLRIQGQNRGGMAMVVDFADQNLRPAIPAGVFQRHLAQG